MKTIKTFGEQLSELLKSHSTSPSALAAALGMTSVTGVSRLLRNQASDKKQAQFVSALQDHKGIFTPAEIEKLQKCMDVNRLGKRAYKTQRCIEDLLFQTQPAIIPPPMEENNGSLESHLMRLPPKEPLQLLCFNCIENGVLSAVECLFRDPQRVIEMNHYVSINEDTRNPALLINAASRLLFDSRYHLYTISDQTNGADSYFFAPCMLFVKVGVGRQGEEQLLMIGANRILRYPCSARSPSMMEIAYTWIRSLQPKPQPLRTPYGASDNATVLDLIFSFYQTEKNRACYQIKPDPGTSSFPPEIMRAMMDASPLARTQRLDSLLPLLNARYQNWRAKKKHTYYVCSPAETQAFLNTGFLSDHLFGTRAMTAAERAKVVDSLLSNIQNNPRFHFHFLADEHRIGLFQYTGYEDLGVAIVKRDTHYDLANSSEHLFVSEPMFLTQYINYYLETLLPRHAYGEADSYQMLRQLRAEL